jgi:hypothetical protein
LEVDEQGSWQNHVTPTGEAIDSEFNRGSRGYQEDFTADKLLSAAIWPPPNLDAMNAKGFENYLEKLRKLRPKFREWLETRDSSRGRDEQLKTIVSSEMTLDRARKQRIYMYELAQDRDGLAQEFINLEPSLRENPSKAVIHQQPHRVAGLFYTELSPLQSRILFKPFKGRLLTSTTGWTDPNVPIGHAVATAGLVATLPDSNDRKPLEYMDWGPYQDDKDVMKVKPREREKKQGNVNVRLTQGRLISAPSVLGRRPKGLTSVSFRRLEVEREWDASRRILPGSKEWILQTASKLVSQTGIARPTKKVYASYTPVYPPGPGASVVMNKGVLLELDKLLTKPEQ